MTKRHFSMLVLTAAAALSGCSGAKETLGLTKKAPDEFAVVKRAPLEMPPDFNLRPPAPGAPRPQETAPIAAARATVFGGAASTQPGMSAGENALLRQAGAGQIDPGIRQKVDAETTKLKDVNKPVTQKLLGLVGSQSDESASVVDAPAEAERLKKNKASGKPATTGKTPTIDE